jgi:hypothetical protein
LPDCRHQAFGGVEQDQPVGQAVKNAAQGVARMAQLLGPPGDKRFEQAGLRREPLHQIHIRTGGGEHVGEDRQQRPDRRAEAACAGVDQHKRADRAALVDKRERNAGELGRWRGGEDAIAVPGDPRGAAGVFDQGAINRQRRCGQHGAEGLPVVAFFDQNEQPAARPEDTDALLLDQLRQWRTMIS